MQAMDPDPQHLHRVLQHLVSMRVGYLPVVSLMRAARGLLLTFGVFQTYYEQVLVAHRSSSAVSWISTTGAFVVLSAGIVTGPLYDRGYYPVLLLFGSLLQVFGMMMLSLATEYYQLFLSQAICVGLGAGIVFTPSVAAAAACLTSPATRAKAMGLMACGSSIGTGMRISRNMHLTDAR
jgi:predicted MFS family arabinose efflux permease